MTPGARQATAIDDPSTSARPTATESPSRGLRRPPVSPWVRAALLTLGAVLIAIGIAGLVLPGIQGVVTILAGLVVVSLGSHAAHRRMRRGLRRWPRALEMYETMRRKLRRRFRKRRPERWPRTRAHRRAAADAADSGEGPPQDRAPAGRGAGTAPLKKR